jgi:uncharacterized protein involved in exopolysaccharide biosynthesis
MDASQNEAYEEVGVLEYLQAFWTRKWEMLFITNCFVIVTLVYIFWLTDEVYEAQATIMPLKSSGANQLTALRNLVPSGFAPFPVSQGEEDLNRFLNILQSRTIAEAVVSHLDLVNLLHADKPPEKRPAFQRAVQSVKRNNINVSDNTQGVVQITGQASAPQLAADIANACVQHLHLYLKENTTTESRRNRIFVENQYQKAQQDLRRAELELQTFQERHKLFSIAGQTDQMIASLGALQGNLRAKEIELNVLKRGGIAENNPQYKMIIYEIDELKKQIAEIEKGVGGSKTLGAVALKELPELQRQLAQLMRERTMQETLHALLAQQLKQAEISEESDEISFLTLDPAIPPLLRVRPNRGSLLLLGAMLGVIFSFAYVTSRVLLERYSAWLQKQEKIVPQGQLSLPKE